MFNFEWSSCKIRNHIINLIWKELCTYSLFRFLFFFFSFAQAICCQCWTKEVEEEQVLGCAHVLIHLLLRALLIYACAFMYFQMYGDITVCMYLLKLTLHTYTDMFVYTCTCIWSKIPKRTIIFHFSGPLITWSNFFCWFSQVSVIA